MFFDIDIDIDIGIGIHIESQLSMFRFVDDISSKMEVFPMSEIWGGGSQFHAKSSHIDLCFEELTPIVGS
jgi:hypothetical protein